MTAADQASFAERPKPLIDPNGMDTIAEYLRAVGRLHEQNMLFRGHASQKWKLIPSAYRDDANGLVTTDQLQRWKAMAQRLAQMPDDTHWLVLAQHFGIATPLLDWTTNPLTALYFACEDNDDNEAGAVIVARHDSFLFAEHTMMITPFKNDRPEPLLIDTSAMNVRSTAQDSFMTLHARDEPPLDHAIVALIPKQKKNVVRVGLRILGLTPERIYPDLAVAAREMKSWLEIDHLIGPSNTGKRPWY